MLTKDGICTLTNVVIVNPMRANLLPWSCTTQAKENSYCNWHPTNQFLPLAIEIFDCLHKHVDVFIHDCANAIWSLKRTKGPSSFYLGHFFSSKSFNHITTCENVFHLKLGDSCTLNYFPTSTPLKHTSHHHGQPIASCQILICKYDQPSTSAWLWTYIDFHSNFEPTWCPITSPFSFILLLCTFP